MNLTPQNPAYFEQLLAFGDDLQRRCRADAIDPIVYGSLAYLYYTRDCSIAIDDIDFLVPERHFPAVMAAVAAMPGTRTETTVYHSVKFFRDGAKIAFDASEHYGPVPGFEPVKVEINGRSFRLLDLANLREAYRRGVETIPVKAAAYRSKLERLSR